VTSGYLILETGEIFEGFFAGNPAETTGEVVFNTGMTGYQEMMTDPSYTGQILVFCYPLIGNYGVNGDDHESKSISARAVVTGEICASPSFYKVEKTALLFGKVGCPLPCRSGHARACKNDQKTRHCARPCFNVPRSKSAMRRR